MKRKLLLLPGALATALLLSACGASIKSTSSSASPAVETASQSDSGMHTETAVPEEGGLSPYHKIDAAEAKKMMENGGVIIVDVRRPEEYEAGHIPGAVNIPNETISDVQPEGLPELDTPLIIYCRTGIRSKQASGKLEAIGYTAIYDMGGITDWPYDKVTGTDPL